MNQLDLNTKAPGEILVSPDANAAHDFKETQNAPPLLAQLEPEAMLGLWLRALLSFFDASNHPLTETEQADLSKRDFSNDLRIARAAFLECSRLAHQLAGAESADDELFEETDGPGVLNSFSLAEESGEPNGLAADQSLLRLTEVLGQFSLLLEDLLLAGPIGFPVWSNVSKMLARELERSGAARQFIRQTTFRNGANLQPPLLSLTRDAAMHRSFATDLLMIFSRMVEMLGWLAVIESSLRRDLPLKQTLPIFTLINQETRELRRFVETHTLRIEELDTAICDVLDGTNYALAMELRKVFSRELVGVNALRHPPTIYAKVETAHGILRDSFQQSIVALTQLFDPTLDGALLFKAYQTKKQQSLTLRYDLWMLLQLIQRAEKERDRHPVVRLIERLVVFQESSLNYLMYKDWEACERFIEEVGAARGAVELAPVLHRFAAFVETLFSQVSMRSVLADCPFDFPVIEK
jgi:hypothetical protein